MRLKVLFVVTILSLMASTPNSGLAERFHVKTTGIRSSGPSLPGNWEDANCYPAIHLASSNAAESDSILLFRENHQLDQLATLTQFFGNQNLDTNNTDVSITMGALGRLSTPETLLALNIRGVSLIGDGALSNFAAVEITNESGQLVDVRIESCLFRNLNVSDLNSISSGGGAAIRADGHGNDAALEIRDCRFLDNYSRGGGGAIFIANGYEGFIIDSEFIGNASEKGFQLWDGRGGAIFLRSNDSLSELILLGCRLEGNTAQGPGGGIFVEDGSLICIDTQISENISAVGGSSPWGSGAGILMRANSGNIEAMRFEMWGCTVQGNIDDLSAPDSVGDGGGVLVKGKLGTMVDVYVTESVFSGNYGAQGGGLYIGRFTTGEVERCSFRYNTVRSNGGATYKGGAFAENLGETVVYNYCEFVGNKAGYLVDGSESLIAARGGAFCTRLYPRAFFYNCTFLDNTVAPTFGLSDAIYMWDGDGVFDDDLKRCRLVNCLFFGDDSNDIQVNMEAGSFGMVTHCAFEEGQFVVPGLTPEFPVILTGSPFSGAEDIHLAENSSCIDAGLDLGLLEDFFDNLVPQGDAPDIGAHEYPQNETPVSDTGQLPGPGLVQSLKAWPNPFNPQTQISFDLKHEANVDLVVYNLQGALVRSLYHGILSPGHQRFPWNGRDDEGRHLPAGTYFYTLTSGGQSFAGKLMLIK